jgi:hypothetical protein
LIRDLNVTIAKYYLPDELFVGQVEEIINMLTEKLANRFPNVEAVNKANLIIARYYLNINRHEARWSTSLQPSKTPQIFR